MPYETGATTGWLDLKARCEAFLTSNGWSQTGDVIHKAAVFIRLYDHADGLRIKGGRGESGGDIIDYPAWSGIMSDANSQIGGPIVWPATYHLFLHTNPDCFVCVLNYNTSYVQWLTAGVLDKTGVWSGGEYFGGSFSSARYQEDYSPEPTASYGQTRNSSPRPNGIGLWFGARAATSTEGEGNMWMTCDLDGAVGDWINNATTPQYTAAYYYPKFSGSELNGDLRASQYSAFNGQVILDPVLVAVTRQDYKHSLVGTPKHVRHCSVRGLGMADIVTLGADRWMTFPLWFKDEADGVPDYPTNARIYTTGTMGFAVAYDGP